MFNLGLALEQPGPDQIDLRSDWSIIFGYLPRLNGYDENTDAWKTCFFFTDPCTVRHV